MNYFFTLLILCCFLSSSPSSSIVSSSSDYITTLTPKALYATSVEGPQSCVKSSDESFAICASEENKVIRFNLQPFSFALASNSTGNYLFSCDLYEEVANSSASTIISAKGGDFPPTSVIFYNASTLSIFANVSVALGRFPQVVVDNSNATAYVSSSTNTAPFIHKFSFINTATPVLTSTLNTMGLGDNTPSALLIIGDKLYVNLWMSPARVARVFILNFTWEKSVSFFSGEGSTSSGDSICNDENFIYDLVSNYLVRVTYKNNNFARVDSLNVFISDLKTIAISPDRSFLTFTSNWAGLFLVNISTFQIQSRAPFSDPSSKKNLVSAGRSLFMNDNSRVYAFASSSFNVFSFDVRRDTPRSEAYPVLNPLSLIESPIEPNSGVFGTCFCTTSSDEKYAICGSLNGFAVRYNLKPFAFVAKGAYEEYLYSCTLFDTGSEATSRAICAKSYSGALFFNVSDMTLITSLAITSNVGYSPSIVVDTPNRVASSASDAGSEIYKIINIDTLAPSYTNFSSSGAGDKWTAAMIIIGDRLFVNLAMSPGRLVQFNLSTTTPTWIKTIEFDSDEQGGYYETLQHDANFVYILCESGILLRFRYKPTLERVDSLTTSSAATLSLGMSPDKRSLFVTSLSDSCMHMVLVLNFSLFGNSVVLPRAFGRPIVTSLRILYDFSDLTDRVWNFSYPCLPGTYCLSASSPGIACSAGNFCPMNSTAPTPCPLNTYSDASECAECTPCPNAGQTNTTGSTNVANCSTTMTTTSNSTSTTVTATNSSTSTTEPTTTNATTATSQIPRRKTRTATIYEEKNPLLVIVSQSVASALVANEAMQTTAMVSVAVFASMSSSPALGFTIGQQQAMTNFAKKALSGDCRGLLPSTTTDEFEKQLSNPLGAADSPLQLSIGGENKLMSYYVGAVIGNFIFTLSLVLLSQGIGTICMIYFKNKQNS
jgi:hypothetical protein